MVTGPAFHPHCLIRLRGQQKILEVADLSDQLACSLGHLLSGLDDADLGLAFDLIRNSSALNR